MFKTDSKYPKLAVVLAVALIAIVIICAYFVEPTNAATAGNEGSFSMPATGAAASITVNNVYAPFGGSMTVYLKNSSGTTIGTNFGSGSWGDEPLTFSFDEVMVYAGQTYSIEIDFSPTAGTGSYGTAYLTYTPYYLITVNSAQDSPTASAYVRSGENYATSVTSPVSGTGYQYLCTGYSIDGGGATAGTSYTFTGVTADHTITYNWQLQYQVTFGVSGMDATAAGQNVVNIVGVGEVAYGSLPYSMWVNNGASVNFTYHDPVASSTAHYRFVLTSGVSSPQTISAPTTITDTYTLTQYEFQVTYSASGLNSSATGTIITIDGSAKTYSDLPFSKYIAYGSSTNFTYATTVASSAPYTQFTLTGATSSPVTVYGGTSISASYVAQATAYAVTYSASGLDASSTGTVITVDGVAKTYADLPFTKYVSTGGSTTFSYAATGASGTTGKQFRLSSSTGSPQSIYGATSISATYVTQYKLTVVTTYSSPYPSAATWYDSGSTVSCTVTSGTVAGSTGYQYIFASWSGSGSGSYTGTNIYPTNIVMNAPITETAVWQTQCYLTVTSTYFTTSGSNWYNQGASASFNLSAPVSAGVGARIAFNGWTGTGSGSYSGSTQYNTVTMNNPITETSNTYVTQYYLTVTSAYGTTTGSNWYNDGATAYAGLSSGTISGGTGIRYSFQSWSVGGTNATQSNPITMSAPTTATASWTTQYYLTVISAYGLPISGQDWYNSGATAYARVTTNIDGTHTLQGWIGDASGTGITSNPITMSTPKTATASWTGTVAPLGPVAYNVTLNGPYNEDGTVGDNTVIFTLSFANNTIYQTNLTSTTGSPSSIYISSTSPFMQLTWNASSTSATLNGTRIYRFSSGVNSINDTSINLYILNPANPAYQYTFSVSDYYGMTNPYLQTSVSPNGNSSYVVEQVNLNETGGYVVFVMQQYQIYTLTFVCEQGSYSQTFTAATLGTPGQLAISLNVLAGNFPSTASASIITAYTNRTSTNTITTTYLDPNSNTTWVAIQIAHLQGASSVTDYTSNSTGNSVTFTWGSADANTDYTVTVTSLSGGVTYTFTLIVPSVSADNPWAAINWNNIGQYIPTLPATYSGWGGIDPTQIIAAALILAALGIGSYYSTGASCLISWIIAGILLKMGWWQGSIPLFALAGFFTILILIDEYKKGNFNL